MVIYVNKRTFLSSQIKKPLHPISSSKVVAAALITWIVPNKMIAMIVTKVGFKFPNPINPSSIPQYLIAFLFF